MDHGPDDPVTPAARRHGDPSTGPHDRHDEQGGVRGDAEPGAAKRTSGPSDAWLKALVVVWTLVGGGLLTWGLLRVFGEPLRFLLAPVLLGSIIVYLLAPVVDALNRHAHLPRPLAVLGTYALAVGVLVLVGWLAVPILSRQLGELLEGLPDIVVGVRDGLVRALSVIGFESVVPTPANGQDLGEWVGSLVQGNGESVVGLLGMVRAFVGSFVSGVLSLVLAPVLAFYVLSDLPRVTSGLQRLVPPSARGEVIDVGRRILTTVGAYFRGQLLVATFVGLATALGLGILGLPFWAIIGGMAGVFNLIPFIGPTVGGIAGVTVALTVGDGLGQAVAVVVVMVLVQQVDNHVITPEVLSRSVHVHPVSIIVSLIVAGLVFGPIGMLVAIPTLAALKLVVLYVLATRVPAMAHLSDPDQFLDGVPLPPARPGSLAGLSQQLRAAWDRRRRDDEGNG